MPPKRGKKSNRRATKKRRTKPPTCQLPSTEDILGILNLPFPVAEHFLLEHAWKEGHEWQFTPGGLPKRKSPGWGVQCTASGQPSNKRKYACGCPTTYTFRPAPENSREDCEQGPWLCDQVTINDDGSVEDTARPHTCLPRDEVRNRPLKSIEERAAGRGQLKIKKYPKRQVSPVEHTITEHQGQPAADQPTVNAGQVGHNDTGTPSLPPGVQSPPPSPPLPAQDLEPSADVGTIEVQLPLESTPEPQVRDSTPMMINEEDHDADQLSGEYVVPQYLDWPDPLQHHHLGNQQDPAEVNREAGNAAAHAGHANHADQIETDGLVGALDGDAAPAAAAAKSRHDGEDVVSTASQDSYSTELRPLSDFTYSSDQGTKVSTHDRRWRRFMELEQDAAKLDHLQLTRKGIPGIQIIKDSQFVTEHNVLVGSNIAKHCWDSDTPKYSAARPALFGPDSLPLVVRSGLNTRASQATNRHRQMDAFKRLDGQARSTVDLNGVCEAIVAGARVVVKGLTFPDLRPKTMTLDSAEIEEKLFPIWEQTDAGWCGPYFWVQIDLNRTPRELSEFQVPRLIRQVELREGPSDRSIRVNDFSYSTGWHKAAHGAMTWLVVLEGEMVYVIINPWDHNHLRLFQDSKIKWVMGADLESKCDVAVVTLRPGDTIFIPAGFIVAYRRMAGTITFGGTCLDVYSGVTHVDACQERAHEGKPGLPHSLYKSAPGEVCPLTVWHRHLKRIRQTAFPVKLPKEAPSKPFVQTMNPIVFESFRAVVGAMDGDEGGHKLVSEEENPREAATVQQCCERLIDDEDYASRVTRRWSKQMKSLLNKPAQPASSASGSASTDRSSRSNAHL